MKIEFSFKLVLHKKSLERLGRGVLSFLWKVLLIIAVKFNVLLFNGNGGENPPLLLQC